MKSALALFFALASLSAPAMAGDFSAVRKVLELNSNLEGREFATDNPCMVTVDRAGDISFYTVHFVDYGADGSLQGESRGIAYVPEASSSEPNNSYWKLDTQLGRLNWAAHGDSLELRTDCSCNKVSRLTYKRAGAPARTCAFD